jgi:cation diffusion facilitator CzcD-associated flavoprotein CzcO
MEETLDFIVIGAGLSGIDAAYRLKTQLPKSSYTILEARSEIGGTWSFFKYPGLRSDSALTTFGFPWRPWVHEKDIAPGPLIVDYITSAARDEGIDKKIQFGHNVTAANWSSEDQQWTLRVDVDGTEMTYRTTFVITCVGYYSYQKGLQTNIPGIENFQGTVVHPQFWPNDLDLAGKRVVLIGSGATAITLLPSLAEAAGHITMLQRSPSYVLSIPSVDPLNAVLNRFLPGWLAFPLNWWRGFLLQEFVISIPPIFPNFARKILMSAMRRNLPESVPVDVHFNPRYNPMEQRLCFCPDGDFFKALHRDNCDIITDVIDTVTADGVITKSGAKLDADIIVTATGLHVQLFSGITPTVDGVPIDIAKTYAWRGCMMTGVPNCGAVIGYTRSSWTLGADACIKMLINVYKHMQKTGATSAMPVYDGDKSTKSEPVVNSSATYFVNAASRLPRSTGEDPWFGRISPIHDAWQRWFGGVTKGMKYTVPPKKRN